MTLPVKRTPRWFVFIIVMMTVTVLLYYFRLNVASSFVPVFYAVVSLMETRFGIAEFSVIRPHGEYLYHLRLVSPEPVTVYGQWFPAMDVSATTLVSHALQHVFVLATVLVGGLIFTPAKVLNLLICTLLALLLSLACDVPLVLLGSIDGVLLDNIAPGQLNTNGWVWWEKFISGGGRMVLMIGLGLLGLTLAQRSGFHLIKSVNALRLRLR